MPTRAFLKALSVLVVFAVLGFLVWSFSSSPRKAIPSLDISAIPESTETREFWAKKIQASDAVFTYEEFKQAYQAHSYGEQHTVAHIFGEVLYDETGIEGLYVCDSAFGYGCYHSFLGKAIAERGLNVLSLFDQACREKLGEQFLPCQHGIGHGILAYVGQEELVEALELCATISWQATGGCTSGVFMEYNFQTMAALDAAAIRTRPLGDDAYAPCSDLPEKFLPSCYFEQPQWWLSVFRGDYEKAGMLCAELDQDALQEACFHGMGNYAAPLAQHDVQEIAASCGTMPGSQGEAFCVEGASWILLGLARKDDAFRLCDGLKQESQRERCTTRLLSNSFSNPK